MSELYTVTLAAPFQSLELDRAKEWCLKVWGTQAVNTVWFRRRLLYMSGKYYDKWYFRSQEDLTMFLLTWSHLVESSPEVDSCD
jgi:hypothetical protein